MMMRLRDMVFLTTTVITTTTIRSVIKLFLVALCCPISVVGAAKAATVRDFTLVVHPQEVDSVHQITGEAVTRVGIFVNVTYPGPSLTVNRGDQVRVKVVNQHATNETVIHFHGQHQVDTFYMDGVAGVTQCAIAPLSSFEYRFTAEPAGTFFYHSHMPYQMGDGVFGAFIVQDPENDPYTADADNYVTQDIVVGLSDWMRYSSDTIYRYTSQFGFDLWPLTHYISLINGQQDFSFVVTQGSTYRLRIYCATVEFGYRLFLTGGHRMTVIAADGALVQPTQTDFLDIYSGERYDVLVTADQEVGTYLLLANILSFTGKLQKEIIYGSFIYEGDISDVDEVVTNQLEAFNKADPTLTLLDQHKLVAYRNEITGKFNDDYQTLPGPKDVIADPWVYKTTSYAVVNESQFQFMDSWDNFFHHKTLTEPTPLLFLGDNKELEKRTIEERREIVVSAYSNSSLTHSATIGPRLQFLELGETIDIVFQNAPTEDNELSLFNAYHPMHIHGHYFWSLASGLGVFDADAAAASANFEDPPMRDNVVVPPHSWVLVRLQANNPGLWLMHCHTETHAMFGMMTILVVGDAAERPTPSDDLAMCGVGHTPNRPESLSVLTVLNLTGLIVIVTLAASALFLWIRRRREFLLPYHRVHILGRRHCGRPRRNS